MVAACTVASSIAVGALSLVDSNQFMTSNAEAIMNAECNNIAADIEAYLGKVELSVDTLSDIALNSIGDFNKFKTDSSYVSDYTSNMEQTLMNSASMSGASRVTGFSITGPPEVELRVEKGKRRAQGRRRCHCEFVWAIAETVCTNCVCSGAHCAAVSGFAALRMRRALYGR